MFRAGLLIAAIGASFLLCAEVSAQVTSAQTVTPDGGPPPTAPGPSAPPRAASLAESAAPEPPAPFEPDVYPPPEARVRTLLIGGGLLAVGYGLALGTSYLWDGAPGMESLRTPVIGAPLAIAESRCGDDEGPGCSTVTVVLRAVLAGVAGLAQVGGIGVLTEGVVMKTHDASSASVRSPAWYALPTASKSGAGVCIGASF